MTDRPTDTDMRAWARLLRAQAGTMAAVETALKAAGMPPLAWYDVLWELERAGDDGLRPADLEARMLLPQYGISRLLDRIEAKGYLKRRAHERDGRGQIITITRSGKAVRARMWPVYRQAVNNGFASRLTAKEAGTLDGILGALLKDRGN